MPRSFALLPYPVLESWTRWLHMLAQLLRGDGVINLLQYPFCKTCLITDDVKYEVKPEIRPMCHEHELIFQQRHRHLT